MELLTLLSTKSTRERRPARWGVRSITTICALIVAAFPALAAAQLSVPGTTGVGAGSDGDFAPTTNITVDLSKATDTATAKWDSDNTKNAPNGVYDRAQWAVVFKYKSVNIPAGVTVTFKNNRSNAPVVWLVSDKVVINGTVNLDGQNTDPSHRAEGGPGGFGGGFPIGSAAGFGIGAVLNIASSDLSGRYADSNGSTSVYGNARILPLIGGSGGYSLGPDRNGGNNWLGGGGGGAILIACPNSVTINGAILCRGGFSSGDHSNFRSNGSGGAIRLIASTVDGIGGHLAACTRLGTVESGDLREYNVLPGRIRIEANSIPFSAAGTLLPEGSYDKPGAVAQIWPDATQPVVTITKITQGASTTAITNDPNGNFTFGLHDVTISADGQVNVVIETLNVPSTDPGKWRVQLRVTPRQGDATLLDATLVSSNGAAAVWQVSFTFPAGISAMQAHAFKG